MYLTRNTVCLACLLTSITVEAQTLPAGVINVPGTYFSIGSNGSIGSNTILNVLEGGAVGYGFRAGSPSGTSTNVQVNVSGGSIGRSFSVYSGSTVNITEGSIDSDFTAYSGSEVNISGGVVSDGIVASSGSVINISGGSVGGLDDTGVIVGSGGVMNITGGTIGNYFYAFSESEVNISAGAIAQMKFYAGPGSEVNISGGSFGRSFEARQRSKVSISGGSFSPNFDAVSESEINLLGKQFVLDGIDITDQLTAFIPFPITDRDVTLSGVFGDGSPFSFDLNSSGPYYESEFSPDAILTLTLLTPGDFDRDGDVDGADFLLWQRNSGDATELANWESNYGDGDPSLSSSSEAVPEPYSLALLALGSLFCSPIAKQYTRAVFG